MAIHGNDIFIAGDTWSDEINYNNGLPPQAGYYFFNDYIGNENLVVPAKGFVAKFDTSLTLVSTSTFGATDVTQAHAIAVDAEENVYVGGVSCGTGLPTSETFGNSAYQLLPHGNCDGFVMKLDSYAGLNANGYSTYIGGSGVDQVNAIAVDAAGNAWITGQTCSPDFPVSSASLSHGSPGAPGAAELGCVAFVSELAANGLRLPVSLLLGGTPDGDLLPSDIGNAIAFDSNGNLYVAGETSSTNFYTTAYALQKSYPCVTNTIGCGGSGFIAHVSTTGLVGESTYFGGSETSEILALQVDGPGNVWVGGDAAGYDNFPDGPAIVPNPTAGFLSKVSGILNAAYSTTSLGAEVSDFVLANYDNRLLGITTLYTTGYRIVPPHAYDAKDDGFMVSLTELYLRFPIFRF
jgi:hypothetical protein